MQPLANHLSANAPSKPQSLANCAIAPSDTTMRGLWIRMLSMYGHKWSSVYGEEFDSALSACLTWQSALSGVTPTQIGDGLRACLQREDPWPPTLPEFRSFCLPPVSQQPAADDWKAARADPAKMPGPKRLAWHQENMAHIQAGGELPCDVAEPRVWE